MGTGGGAHEGRCDVTSGRRYRCESDAAPGSREALEPEASNDTGVSRQAGGEGDDAAALEHLMFHRRAELTLSICTSARTREQVLRNKIL